MDWLNSNVEGFIDRRHSRKYAALMLKHNFIRHTVNKITFSEQCYYIFGDLKAAANSLPAGGLGERCVAFSLFLPLCWCQVSHVLSEIPVGVRVCSSLCARGFFLNEMKAD